MGDRDLTLSHELEQYAFDLGEIAVLKYATAWSTRLEAVGQVFRFVDPRAEGCLFDPLVISSLVHDGLLHDPYADHPHAGQLTVKGLEIGRALLRAEFGDGE